MEDRQIFNSLPLAVVHIDTGPKSNLELEDLATKMTQVLSAREPLTPSWESAYRFVQTFDFRRRHHG